jgi:peptidoglycan/LPS O-acetylase OafA/YrhL
VRYTHLLALFAAASLVVWRRGRGDRRCRALVVTTWLSLLAPLSWLVVFKAHSQDHTHMNFVVWQMPFTLLGFALVGAAARLLSAGSRSPAQPAPPC